MKRLGYEDGFDPPIVEVEGEKDEQIRQTIVNELVDSVLALPSFHSVYGSSVVDKRVVIETIKHVLAVNEKGNFGAMFRKGEWKN